ncbi:hypothetical protein AYI70_g7897 [Smittium culicis]|uniref:Uncharacterized protein n=1 Tax=Smittium culicis TaxID=133412 RepID=A0A1R1XID4_9FUNG|nr:hypothetical protein AYI70_g7897 [Smittium culicis]
MASCDAEATASNPMKAINNFCAPLIIPIGPNDPPLASGTNGDLVNFGPIVTFEIACIRLNRYSDQPTAIVEAPTRYSSTKFIPTIHPKNSPIVAAA